MHMEVGLLCASKNIACRCEEQLSTDTNLPLGPFLLPNKRVRWRQRTKHWRIMFLFVDVWCPYIAVRNQMRATNIGSGFDTILNQFSQPQPLFQRTVNLINICLSRQEQNRNFILHMTAFSLPLSRSRCLSLFLSLPLTLSHHCGPRTAWSVAVSMWQAASTRPWDAYHTELHGLQASQCTSHG